ncbi:MAG: ribonucleoside triphosphate reductase [Candidatus Hadarchaeales archaeon]
MIKKVRKRDGSLVDFDKDRITNTIFRAAQAVGGKDRRIAERLADEVTRILEQRFAGGIPSVEDIQDVIEKVLIDHGHAKTAKAFILYRRQREELRKLRDAELSVVGLVDSYLNGLDWRVRENANINGQTVPGLMFHASNAVLANYALVKIYPPEVADAHVNGDLHLHDLQMSLCGYCAGWSLETLLAEGFNAPGKIHCNPPKHLDTALMQMVNFIGSLQNEWAGAQAFNHMDVLLAPFIRADGLSYEEVKQAVQMFVFNLNISSRWGGQTPFTNLTFALTCPEDLADKPTIVGGEPQDRTYSEFSEEIEMLNKAFIEVMLGGDPTGRVFTFPIPTYGVTKEFPWDSELATLLFKLTAKYGSPYFQNFVNSDMKPSDVRAMCCRLQLDLRELRRNVTGGLFGSSDATGSVGVVTLNMPRLGYLSKDEDEFFERLEWLMQLAKEALEIKRKLVEGNIQNGLLPYTKRYLGTLRNHFSTVGLIGMHEALLNMGFDRGIVGEDGRRFAVKVLKFMREKLREFQEETGNLYNLEATPAEGTSYRLARIDKRKYPEIITAGEREPFYTNSTCLPVNHDLSLKEALQHQEELQGLYSGGTVFHVYLSGAFERLPDLKVPVMVGDLVSSPGGCSDVVRKIVGGFRIPYFTLTPTFSLCENHGYMSGEHFKCPVCGRECEVYSRVVGYYRPVRRWNAGKQEEFRLRSKFDSSIL